MPDEQHAGPLEVPCEGAIVQDQRLCANEESGLGMAATLWMLSTIQ